MKNIFAINDVQEIISRINALCPESENLWGKMDVARMLAHCNVAYELVYTNKHPKPKGFQKFLIKLFAKNVVVGPKRYKRNSRTAPVFLINDPRDFEKDKQRLIEHVLKTQKLGAAHFDGMESHAFGKLTVKEWNTLFYKHLDHHLEQFGV